jgi:hypothetical protein
METKLPGAVEGKYHRYLCFLCEKEHDIFSVNFLEKFCVCHRCKNDLTVAACKVKLSNVNT